jgi:hypothetical protein
VPPFRLSSARDDYLGQPLLQLGHAPLRHLGALVALLLREFPDLQQIDDFLPQGERIADPEWPWTSADEYRSQLDEARWDTTEAERARAVGSVPG